MKVVVYHYIRPTSVGLPYFPYLHLDDFQRQLDHFAQTEGFVTRDAFVRWVHGYPPPRGVLLTFDDGLRDHVDFVLPMLRARGLFGLFYVPTAPAVTGDVLDVHKVHLALGKLGGHASLEWLKTRAPALLPTLEGDCVSTHYAVQCSDKATKVVKQLFNWLLAPEERRAVLNGLLRYAFEGAPPIADEIYLGAADLQALTDAGMGVGPHGHHHRVLSQLQPEEQKAEIEFSCDVIEQLGGNRRWGFCYPHGLRNAFNSLTEAAVLKAGCPFAFAVEEGEIQTPLAQAPRYALPRRDCSTLVHGAPSFGAQTR